MADFKYAFQHIIGPTLLGNVEFADGGGGDGGNGGNATQDGGMPRTRRDQEDDAHVDGGVYVLVPRTTNGKRAGPRRFFGAIGTLIVVGNKYVP